VFRPDEPAQADVSARRAETGNSGVRSNSRLLRSAGFEKAETDNGVKL
jgi:hypothetical protein